MTGDHDQQWGKYSGDYQTSAWLKDVIETPFLEGQFKSIAQKALDRGKPWKALDIGCGMGRYTVRLLQAGG
jgi:ubiquinone/menaquinone biosynthesis C-methylase UbiE